MNSKTLAKHEDLNGNILGIIRGGETGTNGRGVKTYGEIDEIQFTYRGNQLSKVDELKN